MLFLEMFTLFGIFALIINGIYALKTGKTRFLKNLGFGMFLWIGFYFVTLILVSHRSGEKLLDWNETKRFAGFYLDDHLAASIEQVKKVKSLGEFPSQSPAQKNGDFYLVTLKISSNARRATLRLHDPIVEVIDDKGREYAPKWIDRKGVDLSKNKVAELEQPVGPHGDSFTKELVFELPGYAKNPRLLITEGSYSERFLELFLIGDEDSLFHKHTYFCLETDTTPHVQEMVKL